MDAFDDGGIVSLNADDEQARRIASLALEFMNATGAITSSRINECVYADLKPDSFARAFSRDRERLALCGLVLERYEGDEDGPAWRVDARSSFVEGRGLSERDAVVLDVACRPLVSDPAFPYGNDLRLALAKVDRSFQGVLPDAPVGHGTEDEGLRTMRTCFDRRRACRIDYEDAAGRRSDRTIATYGFFGLRGRVYAVAAQVVGDEPSPAGPVRDFRTDRVVDAEEVAGISYEIPDDFFVGDYVRLPFQLGPELFEGEFLVPGRVEREVRRDATGHGSFLQAEGGWHWRVGVSDVPTAASWAISEGIRPVSPAVLVTAWRGLLGGVVGDGGR